VLPIGRRIADLAAADPERPAITFVGEGGLVRSVPRGELDRRTNRLARAYAGLGAGQDDLVTITLPNGIEFYEAAIAIWTLGATPQPVSSRLPDRERLAIVDLAQPALVVGVEEGSHGGRRTVPAGFEADPDLADTALPDAVAASWKAPTSGGSTGRPKLILAAQPGVVDVDAGPRYGMPSDGVQLVPGPLYHNSPFVFSMHGLFFGNQLVVLGRFDAALSLEMIERHRVDWVVLVPTMVHRIWRLPEEERLARDVSSLRTVLHLAAPCPPWLKQAWIDWLGVERICELYGGTEAQAATWITGPEWLAHRGSVGRFVSGEARILDPDGNDVPPGEVGEVFLRSTPGTGPTDRYLGAQPRERDGWESLGDMGSLDADGYLYLADREADMILAGGANVYPAEIEAGLDEHSLVRSSAVIGLPDDDMGQRIHAIIQLAGELGAAELRAHLAERVVSYKIPRSFERVEQPLRDDAGKVRRSALRHDRVPELGGA